MAMARGEITQQGDLRLSAWREVHVPVFRGGNPITRSVLEQHGHAQSGAGGNLRLVAAGTGLSGV